MRSLHFLFALTLVANILPRPAFAVGYWNVPGTFCQCMGYGCGAGYHAPLVLGPVSWEGWCAHKEIRLPYAPSPSCTPYVPIGCGMNYPFEEPTRLMPTWYAQGPAQSATFAPVAGDSQAATIEPPPHRPVTPHSLFGPPVEP